MENAKWLKKLLAGPARIIAIIKAFFLPATAGSTQIPDVTEYSSAAEWIMSIDIAQWAKQLKVATYSNIDEWTENAEAAEWAKKTDILSYAADIVYVYKYKQTEEQIALSGKIDTTVIVHADGTEESVSSFPIMSNAAQTQTETAIHTESIHQPVSRGKTKINWKALLEPFTKENDYMKLNPPATEQQISEVEEKLNIQLPDDLKGLLRELNGDDWLLLSTVQMIEINLMVRAQEFYMPLDCLLFFGGNGCGDYYGYPITREDGLRDGDVLRWNHENDSREWVASGLKDTIEKYYNDQI